MTLDPNWKPSAETCLREAKKHLDWAHGFSHAAHALELSSSRPEPALDPTVVAQRQAIFKIGSSFAEKEFQREMDTLVHWWKTYREVSG